MILVDTSIWIDHFHRSEQHLVELLDAGLAACHPMVIGELALGSIHDRVAVLAHLGDLPAVEVATHSEVIALVSSKRLYGRGLSLVDAHLLASTLITPEAQMWPRDRRLAGVLEEVGVAARV